MEAGAPMGTEMMMQPRPTSDTAPCLAARFHSGLSMCACWCQFEGCMLAARARAPTGSDQSKSGFFDK